MKKIALITGASRGIGAATATRLAKDGYDVCINYQSNQSIAEKLADELAKYGGNVIAVQADISQENEVEKLFSEIDNQLGLITALVNNVGVVAPKTTIEYMTAKRINQLFQTNVIGHFLCCREAVKRMAKKHGGSGGAIVNISSIASRIGGAGEYIDYAASKGAIDSLTLELAQEVVSEGIRVNCVRPGLINTDIHANNGEPQRIARIEPLIPMKRAGTTDEIANAVAWLLSDEASYMTGAFIDVSGGR